MATWHPYWLANTVYAATAVVIPTANEGVTTFTGYTWRCTTAGTSAGSEPAWPANPSITPTVTDGTVTWSVGTGFRQALQAGVLGIVQTFSAANPTIIRQVRHTRPRSLTTVDLPVFWVGDFGETVAHADGVRTRNMEGFSCYLADFLGEQMESDDRINFVVDCLTDLFTENYHAASGRSILQHTATNDTEFNEGGVIFPGIEFVFGRTSVAEGRD